MAIITGTIPLDELKRRAACSFGDMVKAVVDEDAGLRAKILAVVAKRIAR
jgi:hypothetical protein